MVVARMLSNNSANRAFRSGPGSPAFFVFRRPCYSFAQIGYRPRGGSMGNRLSRYRTLLLGSLGLSMTVGLAGLGLMHAAAQSPTPPDSSPAAHRAVLDQYCVVCHNGTLKTASLELDSANIQEPAKDALVWEKVIRKLRMQAMPPQGMPRPEKATYDGLMSYLVTTLDKAAADNVNPGRPALHRLNRAEYANANRDLRAVHTA